MIESLLLTTTNVLTLYRSRPLTNATGFFFERDQKLFLVTSGHVLMDEPSDHFPDYLEILLHTSSKDWTKSIGFSIPLYANGRSMWRQGLDSAGEIDVAVIELDRSALPDTMVHCAFTPKHLLDQLNQVGVGTTLLIVGYPLGFHDTVYHMPVVRQAAIASSFGLRFQGNGHFLTDARTHRGTSGAPVVMRYSSSEQTGDTLPWYLLGVHSSRFDLAGRDLETDEALGLNCAWYSDILLTLTNEQWQEQSRYVN
jgi:hypothetical protein